MSHSMNAHNEVGNIRLCCEFPCGNQRFYILVLFFSLSNYNP